MEINKIELENRFHFQEVGISVGIIFRFFNSFQGKGTNICDLREKFGGGSFKVEEGEIEEKEEEEEAEVRWTASEERTTCG